VSNPTDRDLVRLYWPVELRSAFDALFAIDDAMGDVVARATEPALAAIKLAWWRERLEELDAGKVPAEPRLQAAADELLTRSIGGASLAELEDGWAALLEADPDPERVAARGAKLFGLASSLLGTADPMTGMAGRLYALVRLGHRPAVSAELARHPFPRALRPLTALAALAARDARRGASEPQGTPGRAWTLLRHRLTGRIG
jgi:phytoene synthase